MLPRLTLYYIPSPNGRKVSIALEEMELDYEVRIIDIFKGETQQPGFLAINPNGKIPAMVVEEPGGETYGLFESGAILQYLGRLTGQLYPAREARRTEVDSWLHWQMSALGPMSGQITWFRRAARKEGRDPATTSLPLHRYTKEVKRLYGVLERQLEGREYICEEYSLADIACWTWVEQYGEYAGNLAQDFPSIRRWHQQIACRPAVQRAMLIGINSLSAPEEFLSGEGR